MSRVISARIKDELYDLLNEIAKERERKVAEIIQEAILLYVEQHAEHHIALERMNNPRAKFIGEEELLERLGWTK